MKFLRTSSDPLTEKSDLLSAEIARLEKEIALLSTSSPSFPQPKFRSTAFGANVRQLPSQPTLSPQSLGAGTSVSPVSPANGSVLAEPKFPNHPNLARTSLVVDRTDGLVNDLGLKKYDLVAQWRRIQANFRGTPTSSSKMVHFLAAGSVQGLQPLRYERRIARNRTLALFGLLLAVLWGLAHVYLGQRTTF